MQNTTTHNKDERHSLLEKYPSHILWKGCVWEGVGDLIELQHIDPHSIVHNRISFPFSWAAQPEAWRPSLSGCWFSLPHLISNSSDPQLLIRGLPLLGAGFPYRILSPTGLVSELTELYNSSTPASSCGRHNHTHSNRPRSRLYSDIPWADAPVIYIGAFPNLTARPGRRSIYNIDSETNTDEQKDRQKSGWERNVLKERDITFLFQI